MDFVAEMTLRDLGLEEPESPLARYRGALISACAIAPPPFGTRRYGEIYRTAALDPGWVAETIIKSAEREGDGSTRLWSLASCTDDGEIRGAVKQHAIDEARHARWYLAVLDLVFPGAVERRLRRQLNALSPGYKEDSVLEPVPGSPFAHAVSVDDLVQMNIAEIRTSVNQRLQRPVLRALCHPARIARLDRLLDRLLLDEIRHVAYSARLIERLATESQESLDDLMLARIQQFNELTCSEIEDKVFPLHCSREECRTTGVCVGAESD